MSNNKGINQRAEPGSQVDTDFEYVSDVEPSQEVPTSINKRKPNDGSEPKGKQPKKRKPDEFVDTSQFDSPIMLDFADKLENQFKPQDIVCFGSANETGEWSELF